MPFANGFNGDVVSLQHILQTLERKEVAIPGLTCAEGLSVSAMGETAYYFTRSASSVATGNLGDKMEFTSGGLTRVDIPITKAIQIKSVLPNANVATVSMDVVADRVIYETISASNKYNEEFLEALCDSTVGDRDITGTTAGTAQTVYGIIVDAVKEFKVRNKAKGMKPTAIVVGPTWEALLKKSPEFLRSTELGDDVASYEGVIGKVAGIPVVVAVDLDETGDKLDFILMNAEGFGAPQNVKSLVITDATQAGYPAGTLIAGEIGHGFKIADKDLVLLRKHA